MSTNPTRRAPRVVHEVLVGVTSDAGTFTGWGTNLSAGGLFVNSSSAAPKGTTVTVLLQLPGADDVKIRGRVAWSQPAGEGVGEPGMGIEFLDVDAETKRLVGEIVEKLQKDLTKPA